MNSLFTVPKGMSQGSGVFHTVGAWLFLFLPFETWLTVVGGMAGFEYEVRILGPIFPVYRCRTGGQGKRA